MPNPVAYKVFLMDRISEIGINRLPKERFQITSNINEAEVLFIRSTNIHQLEIPPNLLAVGRAGAGVNNIPIKSLGEKGIPVFNAPGANANAVKELVQAGLLMSSRNLFPAWDYVRQLTGTHDEIKESVEKGKRTFAGFELPGKSIGVVGLGKIGGLVANACLEMGMQVTGYDPMLTVEGAWQLSSDIRQAKTLKAMIKEVDFLSLHIPLNDQTIQMLNDDMLAVAKPDLSILNFARGELVSDSAILKALSENRLRCYVTDFPNPDLIGQKGVYSLPHLGASTLEAEDNSATMVVDQVIDYLDNGNLKNSVNYPNVSLSRGSDYRLIIVNTNVPSMLGQISTKMANAGLNIHDMINQSRGDLAFTIVDTDSEIDETIVSEIAAIKGVLMARRV